MQIKPDSPIYMGIGGEDMISILYGAFLLGLTGLLIAQSPIAAQAAQEGLLLCGKQLVPALFPFFVVSSLFLGQQGAHLLAAPLKPLAGILGLKSRQAPLILFLSWVGGYGVCAKMVRDSLVKNQLTYREAQLLLLAGTTSSPGFVIGAVGGALLGNPELGIYLYLACLVGNLACCLLWRLFLPLEKSIEVQPDQASPATLSQSIQGAVQACLTICGCVVFFRVIGALITELLGMDRTGNALLAGLLEISSGCAALAALTGSLSIYGCCAALSLLSISVFCQMSSLLEHRCSLTSLIISRPVHLAVSLGSLSLLLRLFPQTTPVYNSLSPRLVLGTRTSPDTALLVFGMCCLLLRLLQQKNRPNPGGSSGN